jgi:hypothetical protein
VKLWCVSPIYSNYNVRLSQEYSRRPRLGNQIALRPYNIDKEWSRCVREQNGQDQEHAHPLNIGQVVNFWAPKIHGNLSDHGGTLDGS